MEHVITSVLILKYSISANIEKSNEIINNFVYNQVYKGNRPDEFFNRPETQDKKSQCYIVNDNFVIAYQNIELEHSVKKTLTNSEFLKLFKANLLKNLRTKFEDSNYDLIQDLKVLDHVILNRSDRDE